MSLSFIQPRPSLEKPKFYTIKVTVVVITGIYLLWLSMHSVTSLAQLRFGLFPLDPNQWCCYHVSNMSSPGNLATNGQVSCLI